MMKRHLRNESNKEREEPKVTKPKNQPRRLDMLFNKGGGGMVKASNGVGNGNISKRKDSGFIDDIMNPNLGQPINPGINKRKPSFDNLFEGKKRFKE